MSTAQPATYAALAVRVLAAVPRLGGTRLVCIDGPAGSGKTTFADRLATAVQQRSGQRPSLVHMEDLYTGDDRPPGDGVGGGGSGGGGGWSLAGSADRLETAVLAPVRAGRAGSLRRWDWVAGRPAGDPVAVAAGAVLVVEGCGSAAHSHDRWTSLRIWVQAPAEICLRRGLARDGAALRPHWERWQADERVLFAAEGTRARADVRVDGAAAGSLPADRYATL